MVMGRTYIKVVISVIFIQFFIFLGCSSSEEDKEAPIDLKGMHINQVYNRTPQDTETQVDLELYGEVAKENLKQDILYEWHVQYKNIDINNKDSVTNSQVVQQQLDEGTNNKEEFTEKTNSEIDVSSDNNLIDTIKESEVDTEVDTKKDPYSDYFFISTSSKDPLHAILSVYHPGYYIVSLDASNIQESKIYSVMIKVGQPDIPHLFLKVNVPKFKSLKKQDCKGRFFIKYNNEESPIHSNNFIEISASEMGLNWYDTGIIINPFSSFNIKSGTHILDNDDKTLACISNSDIPIDSDVINYQFGDDDVKVFNNSSAVFDSFSENSILSVFKDGKSKWLEGDIYTDALIWKTDTNNSDKFLFVENSMSSKNTKFSVFLDNAYLVKVFIGSFGHRVPYNKYFVYFGPKGTEAEELDTKGERDFPALPYGYLIGKLGENGEVFPIGDEFSYKHLFQYDLYEKSDLDNFVVSHSRYIPPQEYSNDESSLK